jgi:hypothetical protein
MELALAQLSDHWCVSLYLPAEHRFIDGPHTYASALAALAYAAHWQALGATIRPASQAAYAALEAEAAAASAVVRAVGD